MDEDESSLTEDEPGAVAPHQTYVQVGPFQIRRSDGFHSPWEQGTDDQDVRVAVRSAIKRAMKSDT